MPLTLLITLGLIWGVSNMLTKLALLDMETFAFTFWQAGLAFLLLAGLTAARGVRPPLDRQHLRYYAVNGMLGLALPGLNIAIVVQHIPAGLVSVIVSTATLFTYVLSLLAGQEKFQPVRGLGIVVGLAGAMCILLPSASLPEADMWQWVLLGMLTPLFYGLNGVFAARFMPEGTDAAVMASGLLGVTALAYLVLMLGWGQPSVPWPPHWPGSYALYALSIGASVAFVVYFRLIRSSGEVYMSQVGYVVVAVGILAGMIVFGERHSLWVWGGMALMLAGVALVNSGQQRQRGGRRKRSASDWWCGAG